MHHQDFSGDPPGSGSGGRKAAYHYRRGSSGAPGSPAAAGSAVNPGDDNPSQAGSSSPALHHQAQAAGAQVKKKSGFQITSVTSAQINVSGNNSLADDTESYDDMDESHTEDLSSSDMLDVSMSKATDTGVPERSSSDETLNSLHGVDTPGLVSPNEPLHPQATTTMVNGTVHQHYYPQSHHHHSDSVGGGDPSLPTLPVANSSPAQVSKPRPAMLDNTKQSLPPAVGGGGTGEPHLQGGMNISSAVVAPAGFDNTNTSGQVPPPPSGPNAQAQQTQTATGSRFRVVKLDTNSEPFRKGRWTCTEYYEKEIPNPVTVEAPKGAEVVAEAEPASGNPGVQPPHTLQPYPQPGQDFTSPQAMQSPPQGLPQAAPLTYLSPQEMVGGVHVQKPVVPVTLPAGLPQAGTTQPPSGTPQQLPYAVDPHQAPPQAGYPAPQLIAQAGVRQPDFIQPTAPFQTQVQPPLPHIATAISVKPIPQSASIPQQLPHQGQIGQPAPAATFVGQPQSLPSQPPTTAVVPGALPHGTPYMPLPAVLQPLLTPGATLTAVPGGGGSIKASQLEDAQKLLLQHQSLLSFPRLGEGAVDVGGAAGALAQMGMSAEASAFMAAAAAGLRTQHAEGEEDR